MSRGAAPRRQASQVRWFSSFGVAYSIETPDAPRGVSTRFGLVALRAVLPPGTRRTAAPRGGARRYRISTSGRAYDLRGDDVVLAANVTARSALDVLEGDLALHVAATAPAHVFIHAGVVAHRGRALLVPGRTYAGKSTLIASLVRKGAVYYSDEYAVLDASGRCWPYPRPMSLRRARGAPRRLLPARRGRRPLRLGWVVGVRYDAGIAGLLVESLSAGRVALLLLDNAVAARLATTRVMPVLRAAVDGAVGFSGLRGTADRAAAALLADCL